MLISFDQNFKALCCNALPYENVIVKLVSFIKFILFRFFAASNSDCPPDKKATPGTSDGTDIFKHFRVSSAIFLVSIFISEFEPGKIIFGFNIVPLRSILFFSNSSKHFLITSDVLLKHSSTP